MTKTWKKKLMIGSLALASVMVLSAPKAEAFGVTGSTDRVAGFTGVGSLSVPTHRMSPEHGSLPLNKYEVNVKHPEAAESCTSYNPITGRCSS